MRTTHIGVATALLFAGFGCGSQNSQNKAAALDPTTEFWIWFRDNAESIAPQGATVQGREADDLTERLQLIDNKLVWEILPSASPKQLVISADGNADLFPTVRKVVAAAPKIPGWTIVSLRQPGPTGVMQYQDARADPDKILYTTKERDGKLDIELFVPGVKGEAGDNQVGAIFLLLDTLIGELLVETRIGSLDFFGVELAPKSAKPLRQIAKETMFAEEIRAGRTQ